MKYVLLIFFTCGIALRSVAGTVDTVSVYSNSMHKEIKTVVIKPNNYDLSSNHYAVVYLLHGYLGDFSNWVSKVSELKSYVDDYGILIVCPDGSFSSWYFDSPIDTGYRYETHVALEVVNFIDKNYKTMADKDHRAIAGLSMGGHGALFLGLRHTNIFGAAGSMSGVVDLKDSRNRYDISKRIGDTVLYAKNWHDFSVFSLIEKYVNTDLKIIIDCGFEDVFIACNRRLHQKMLQLEIPHEYTERPGLHNWDYWRNAVSFQLLFFHRFFRSAPH